MTSEKGEQGIGEAIRIVTGLAALRQSVRDEFFARRVGDWSADFLESYLTWRIRQAESPGGVAQCINSHLVSVGRLLDLLDEISYLRLGAAAPLSVCRFRLMRYKLSVLGNLRALPAKQPASVKTEKPVLKAQKVQVQKINRSSELILDFIRTADRVRAKDLVEQFSALSERTVKRSLHELTHLGLLKKTSENRATYYSVA